MNNLVWMPKNIEKTAMTRFMRTLEQRYPIELNDYLTLHAWSIQNSELFWQETAAFFNIHFNSPAKTILKKAPHMIDTTWFEGATLNVVDTLLRREDDHPALISIQETGERHVITYKSLKKLVAECAAGLKAHGIQAGDRVAGMLPNNAYAIIAMLASASLGATWSACSPDFGVSASIDRFSQITPKLLFICDAYTYHGTRYELKEKAEHLLSAIPSIQKLIICKNLADANLTPEVTEKACRWDDFLVPNQPLQTVPQDFNHPWYILFSSGTTGAPKCIVHRTGGTLLQHMKELGLHTDLNQTDTLFFHTTCGWMMWNWMVSALALGSTLILYDGSPMFPKIDRIFKLLHDESVSVFGTSARFLAAVEKRVFKPNQHIDFPALRTILSTGSPLLPEQYDFVRDYIHPNIQLSSISGGTDIISCFALGNPISPVYRGELQCLGLGLDVQVFDDAGQAIIGQAGELVCINPCPSMPLKFWNDSDGSQYRKAYFERFPGVWAHGDMAERTEHGGLIIYGRSDATLNPGGVRIGTAEVYRPLKNIPEVLDSIVIGQPWNGDVRIILFVQLQPDVELDNALRNTIRQMIRTEASPRHVPAKILQVLDIPRTINGKIVEIAVRQTVQGEPVKNLGSLANPESLEYFKNRPELMEGATEKT